MKTNTFEGKPTKEFFIHMLTKDIKLERAIIDLIDNSIDGAKRLKGSEDYNGLWVKLKISPNRFEIIDNCGGFTIDIAKKYAFMFGRPDDAQGIKHSVGRFGVGMKRALFKMGKRFTVESKSGGDHFSVKIDVEEWKNKTDDWNFKE